MAYTDLFIDFDDTLYDTHGNAVIALGELFEDLNFAQYFPSLEAFTVPYWKANVELWDLYSRGQVTRDYLMVERFRRPLACGFVTLSDGTKEPFAPSREYCLEVSDHFLDLCACKPGVVPGAHNLMRHLKQRGYRLHMCSNGFHEVQYRKLRASQLLEFFDSIVLSDAAGANKPSKQFFDYAFSQTGADPATTLMIGDNFQTDILGAKAVGLDVMFFNRHPESFAPTEPVTYHVTSLQQIIGLL